MNRLVFKYQEELSFSTCGGSHQGEKVGEGGASPPLCLPSFPCLNVSWMALDPLSEHQRCVCAQEMLLHTRSLFS